MRNGPNMSVIESVPVWSVLTLLSRVGRLENLLAVGLPVVVEVLAPTTNQSVRANQVSNVSAVFVAVRHQLS